VRVERLQVFGMGEGRRHAGVCFGCGWIEHGETDVWRHMVAVEGGWHLHSSNARCELVAATATMWVAG
jgi:hypothetical protein